MTLLLAHLWLPAKRLRVVDVAPGVIVTFVCSIGFGEAFGVYLSEFARNYVSTYAGLASVMIALVFLYSLAAIFVFGGELNAAIMRARKVRPKRRRWRLAPFATASRGYLKNKVAPAAEQGLRFIGDSKLRALCRPLPPPAMPVVMPVVVMPWVPVMVGASNNEDASNASDTSMPPRR